MFLFSFTVPGINTVLYRLLVSFLPCREISFHSASQCRSTAFEYATLCWLKISIKNIVIHTFHFCLPHPVSGSFSDF